ncbi:MAG: hypothetical protein AAF290_15425 [Pseudomonadota bacterium]
MTTATSRFTIVTYASTAFMAFMLWQQGWYFGAVLALTLGGGLAMSQPVIERRKLCLRGTPVLLMFAVMLVSASGMTVVADEVGEWIAPAEVPAAEAPCAYAEMQDLSGVCEHCAAD